MDKLEALYNKLIKIKEELIKTVNQSPDSSPVEVNKKDRCWDGYEPTPGKKAYSDGSCRPINKEEEMEMCDNGQWNIRKSNYGPKGAGQYTPEDNAKRKMNNTGDAVSVGPNQNVKSYSTKPGQLSTKSSATLEASKYRKLSAKNPVKVFSEEEKARLAEQMKLKKP